MWVLLECIYRILCVIASRIRMSCFVKGIGYLKCNLSLSHVMFYLVTIKKPIRESLLCVPFLCLLFVNLNPLSGYIVKVIFSVFTYFRTYNAVYIIPFYKLCRTKTIGSAHCYSDQAAWYQGTSTNIILRRVNVIELDMTSHTKSLPSTEFGLSTTESYPVS